MLNIPVSTKPADGLAPPGTGASAGAGMCKAGPHIYRRPWYFDRIQNSMKFCTALVHIIFGWWHWNFAYIMTVSYTVVTCAKFDCDQLIIFKNPSTSNFYQILNWITIPPGCQDWHLKVLHLLQLNLMHVLVPYIQKKQNWSPLYQQMF